jgi:hypothetical protein
MTSLPGYPGVSAVVLFREEIDKDDLQVKSHYERIKILTEKGKDLANVELPFFSTTGNWDYNGDNKSVTDIVGRTIHPDGTIIPFTGKPYLKTLDKRGDTSLKKLVFTLPDVEVGSIIEYRYSERIDDHVYEAPDWYIQGELYVKSAHYIWYPTTKELVSGKTGAPINAVSWFPVLPEGVKVDNVEHPAPSASGATARTLEVKIKDVPPLVREEYQPPNRTFSYRVLFNFSEYRAAADYWRSEGKDLFKRVNGFASPGAVQEATQKAIEGASSDSDKLKKIYAAVEALENTDYTRAHNRAENKAAGVKMTSAGDVLTSGRGSSWQITETFVAMARAAGMKAYAMYVPDRTNHVFTQQWLNMNAQLDDLIAIVVVDGKEQFFDPGERYCEYGHLAWQHSYVAGLRDSAEGPKLDQTPGESYATNRTEREANLTMDDKGVVTGKISMTYSGAPALAWRHRALSGDEQSIKRTMRTSLERMVPRTLEVKVDSVEGLTEYEKPLVVNYVVKGVIASATGKRLVVAPDLFTMNEPAIFPHEKRENAVYFRYPQLVQDAERINLPASMKIEAVPESTTTMFLKRGQYKMDMQQGATFVTARRLFVMGDVLVSKNDYPALRTFYGTLQSKDKEPVVLTAAEALELPKLKAAPEHGKDADDEDEDEDSSEN